MDDFSKQKTIFTFLDYKYDNGHHGAYPLDTNTAGVLRRFCGVYHVGVDDSKQAANFNKDPELNQWKSDMARLAIIDETFERAYMSTAYKR